MDFVQTALNIDKGICEAVHKFGTNLSIQSTTPEDIWIVGGDVIFPSAADHVVLVSTDANDNGSGTGARTVVIYGLDTNWDQINETVILNGLTTVQSLKKYLRVFRAIVMTAGSGNGLAGTLTGTIGGDTVLQINPGLEQTQLAHYSVPRNYFLAISSARVSVQRNASTALADIQLLIRPFGGVFNLKQTFVASNTAGTVQVDTSDAPFIVPAKSDIKFRAEVTANGTAVNAAFSGLLIRKPA